MCVHPESKLTDVRTKEPRNGNLLANVFLGKLVLHRNYGMQQLAAVALLSFGTSTAVVGSSVPTDVWHDETPANAPSCAGLILVSVAGTSGDQSGLETGRSCLLGEVEIELSAPGSSKVTILEDYK